MRIFQDIKLKKAIKNEKVQAPNNFSKIIDETLNNLEENSKKIPKNSIIKISLKVATSMVILTLLILPNISNDISYAMQEIPVIGSIVKIVTVRRYFDKEGNCELDVEVPTIENADNTSQIINEEVNKFTQRIIDMYNEEKDPEYHLSVKVESEILENNEDWFTLKLIESEVRAGSNIQYKIYHIDKKKDKIIKLEDLFINNEFKKYISEEIKRQMISRMQEDESITYWVNSEVEEWNFNTIEENQNFYFSKDGNIVIIFDKYQVAPGAMGAPEFEINKDIYKEVLKEEYR